MLKKNISAIILSSFLVSNLFANDVVIDKNSEAGKIILTSDKEYKDYLLEISTNKNLEKLLYKQECDINMLKSAVAKLIQNVDRLNLDKQELEKIIRNIHKVDSEHKKIEKDIPKKEYIKEKKKECKKIYKEQDIKGSYIKYIPEKEFKVQTNNLEIYKIPNINSEKIELKLNKGDSFKSDKYTKAGWVYVKDSGWVKGYYLYPKVFQESFGEISLKEECK